MFNKETEYAIRGLVYIQHQNDKGLRPGIIEIATAVKAPQFFIGKILQRLVKQGFLQSFKGKKGGFAFDPEKPNVMLLDIINAIQGIAVQECGFGLSHCDCDNPCPLHFKYKEIRNLMESLITTETIQTLARK
jgi:Rrf2 family protein